MTEKRFIFLDGFSLRYTCICDNQKGHRTNGVLKQDEVLELLNHLHEENEQLKQRNNRQCKQLDRLYRLIEEKDWRALSDIIDDFKKAEEQLQKEWKGYE